MRRSPAVTPERTDTAARGHHGRARPQATRGTRLPSAAICPPDDGRWWRVTPETAPSARTTRACDTPTRNAPVSSLLSTNSSPRGSCRHQAVTLAYCCSSATRAGQDALLEPAMQRQRLSSADAPGAPAASLSRRCAGGGLRIADQPLRQASVAKRSRRSVRPEISRLNRCPVRMNTAQAASSASAARKYGPWLRPWRCVARAVERLAKVAETPHQNYDRDLLTMPASSTPSPNRVSSGSVARPISRRYRARLSL